MSQKQSLQQQLIFNRHLQIQQIPIYMIGAGSTIQIAEFRFKTRMGEELVNIDRK